MTFDLKSIIEKGINPNVKKKFESVAHVFKHQQEHEQFMRKTTAKDRINRLIRLKKGILKYSKDIRAAAAKDIYRSIQSQYLPILRPLEAIASYEKNLSKWLKPKKIKPDLNYPGQHPFMAYEPKGIMLIITPFNMPFTGPFGRVIDAIATGNCAIVKPDIRNTLSSNLTVHILNEIFPENEVFAIEGGQELGDLIIQLPFDHICFTGSSETGSKIRKAAAKTHASVTLEMGGKNPTVIDETANIELAATEVSIGKIRLCGQICISPDYVFVHRRKKQEFITESIKHIKDMIGNTLGKQKTSHNYDRIAHLDHFKKLERLYNDALSKGATIEYGGYFDLSKLFVQPSILTSVPLNSDMMIEEVFGPLIQVHEYENIDDVFSLIKSLPKPLASYIFSNNKTIINQFIKQTSAGGTTINGVMKHVRHPALPFGGINKSGIGSIKGGENVIKEFSHLKPYLIINDFKSKSTFHKLSEEKQISSLEKLLKKESNDKP